MTTVNDIIALMNQVAPPSLAQEWDNCGLQCGDGNWPVKHVMVALDPSLDVVKAACQKDAVLLITHHPLIFRPMKSLVLDTPLGRLLDMAIRHRLAIFSAHTNLDSVQGGLNDVFAKKVGLQNVTQLSAETDDPFVKLAVYVPERSFQQVFDAILETDSGATGKYSGCTFRQKGLGTFIPGKDARPFIGQAGRLETVDEYKIEMRVAKRRVSETLARIRRHHPYETMAYDIFPLYPETADYGIGRVGELEAPLALAALAAKIKNVFALPTIKVSGPDDMPVKKIAVCTGSGAGLMKPFFASGADVYISGDFKFHDAKDAQMQGRALIDAGHFASEIIMTDLVTDRLGTLIREKGIDVTVESFTGEEDPFYYM
jgi:dinuclear metal center YbgI/SA1388 family protein